MGARFIPGRVPDDFARKPLKNAAGIAPSQCGLLIGRDDDLLGLLGVCMGVTCGRIKGLYHLISLAN